MDVYDYLLPQTIQNFCRQITVQWKIKRFKILSFVVWLMVLVIKSEQFLKVSHFIKHIRIIFCMLYKDFKEEHIHLPVGCCSLTTLTTVNYMIIRMTKTFVAVINSCYILLIFKGKRNKDIYLSYSRVSVLVQHLKAVRIYEKDVVILCQTTRRGSNTRKNVYQPALRLDSGYSKEFMMKALKI